MDAQQAFALLITADFWLNFLIVMIGVLGHTLKKAWEVSDHPRELIGNMVNFWTNDWKSSSRSLVTVIISFLTWMFVSPDLENILSWSTMGWMMDSAANRHK